MRILAVSDIESKSLYDFFSPDKVEGVELIIGCGDLREEYLEFLVTMMNVPLLDGQYMYTEREMKRRIFRLWPKIHFHKGFDVLVTHCPARHLNDFDTITHRGFDCFNKLLEKYRPKLFMHGHIHRNYGARIPQKSEHDGTLVINASDYCIFDIDL